MKSLLCMITHFLTFSLKPIFNKYTLYDSHKLVQVARGLHVCSCCFCLLLVLLDCKKLTEQFVHPDPDTCRLVQADDDGGAAAAAAVCCQERHAAGRPCGP